MRRALILSWPWAVVIGGIVVMDEALARSGRPLLTTRYRMMRRTEWGKPIAYGAMAGLAAHLLDAP